VYTRALRARRRRLSSASVGETMELSRRGEFTGGRGVPGNRDQRKGLAVDEGGAGRTIQRAVDRFRWSPGSRRLVPLPNRPECSPIDYPRRNVRRSAPYLRLLQPGRRFQRAPARSRARSVSFLQQDLSGGGQRALWMVSRTVCFWLITQQVGNGGRYKLRARGGGEEVGWGGRERARTEREQWRRRTMPGPRRLCALRKNVNGTFARFGELEYTLTD
jgi:hypothetical protein